MTDVMEDNRNEFKVIQNKKYYQCIRPLFDHISFYIKKSN